KVKSSRVPPKARRTMLMGSVVSVPTAPAAPAAITLRLVINLLMDLILPLARLFRGASFCFSNRLRGCGAGSWRRVAFLRLGVDIGGARQCLHERHEIVHLLLGKFQGTNAAREIGVDRGIPSALAAVVIMLDDILQRLE